MTSYLSLLHLQKKRDILSETKYIELVLVADHQEVSERIVTGPSIINKPAAVYLSAVLSDTYQSTHQR